MEKQIIVFVTCGNNEEARKIARGLVENKLGACVSISKVASFFEWNNKIEEQPEFLLIVKTKQSIFDELEKFIKNNHSYDCPEIIATDITNSSDDYARWVISSVKNKEV